MQLNDVCDNYVIQCRKINPIVIPYTYTYLVSEKHVLRIIIILVIS